MSEEDTKVEETEEDRIAREEQEATDAAEAQRVEDEERDKLPSVSLQELPVDGTVAFRADRDVPPDANKNWPSWRYGPDGQSAIFNNAEEVPEGWVDHPAKVDNPDWKSGDPLPEPEAVEGEHTNADGGRVIDTPPGDNPTIATYESMGKDEIIAVLRAKFIEHNPKWTKAKLIETLSTAHA